MGHYRNHTDSRNSKHSEITLFQCHSLHHKSHVDWPGIESGLSRWEAGDQAPETLHDQIWNFTIRTDRQIPSVRAKQGTPDGVMYIKMSSDKLRSTQDVTGLRVSGKIILKWNLEKTQIAIDVPYIKLAQNRIQWWTVLNTVMNLNDSIKCGQFLGWLNDYQLLKDVSLSKR